MHRIDDSRHSVVSHLRELLRLRLGECGVRCNDADGGVCGIHRDCGPIPAANVDEAMAVRRTRSRKDASRFVIDDIAYTIHGHDSANRHTVFQPNAGCPDAALHWESRLKFSDGGSGSRADAPFVKWCAASTHASLVSRLRIGTNLRVSQSQVIEDRRGNDGDAREGRDVADTAFFEITHHSTGRIESKRAASGEKHSVHSIDMMDRVQKIGFARAGTRSSNIDTGNRPSFGKNNRAARRPPCIRKVSDLYSIDFCNEPVPRPFHNGMLNSSAVNALQENLSLAAWTTFGVGGPARYFVNAQSEADVGEALDFASALRLPVFVLGGGSNLLVADRGFPGIVLRVGLKGRVWEGAQLRAAAGEDWDGVAADCVARGLGGVECLSGIPGLVGGTPVQNVGAYGQEVSETIVSVRAIDRQTGATTTLSPDQCGFAYRTSVFNSTQTDRYLILEVTYVLKKDAAPQVKYPDLARRFEGNRAPPTLADVRRVVREVRHSKGMLLVDGDQDCRSAGSFFKNPILTEAQYAALQSGATETVPRYSASSGNVKTSAAWLIERAGFGKGFAIGPAAVSSKHTLAIVNRGGARAEDLLTLAKTIRRGVKDKFGVRLVPEPVFVGFKEEEWS